MATLLRKTVVRKAPDMAFMRGNRHVIISIEPGTGSRPSLVGIRFAGTRQVYRATLLGVANWVVMTSVDADARRLARRSKEIAKSQNIPLRSARKLAKLEAKREAQGV